MITCDGPNTVFFPNCSPRHWVSGLCGVSPASSLFPTVLPSIRAARHSQKFVERCLNMIRKVDVAGPNSKVARTFLDGLLQEGYVNKECYCAIGKQVN